MNSRSHDTVAGLRAALALGGSEPELPVLRNARMSASQGAVKNVTKPKRVLPNDCVTRIFNGVDDLAVRDKTTDIGEKFDPLDVVFGVAELSQPAIPLHCCAAKIVA